MNKISFLKGILEERGDCVDVIFTHFADVLKQEWKSFQHTILYVQFWDSVLIHQTGENLKVVW